MYRHQPGSWRNNHQFTPHVVAPRQAKVIEDIEQAGVSIYMNYSDTENWQRGVEWRREQVEAEQKRKAEQEKRDLLRGL